MPISLDTFQRTLDTGKVQSFVKLSTDGADVKTVGGGFFARHFGLYKKPTAEENNAVRREFYESIVDKYHCQGAILDQLRQDLGIDAEGASTGGERLSVRDAQEILARVQKATDLERVKAAEAKEAPRVNEKERRAFYESIRKSGHCRGAILSHVTERLGLNNPAVVQTKLSEADKSAIRSYADEAFANFTARENLYKQLVRDGLCQGDIGKNVRAMLDLDDSEGMLKPLTPELKESIIAFAKEQSAPIHAGHIAALGLPSEDALARLVAPARLPECKALLANVGATPKQLTEITRAINEFSIAQEHESWSTEVDGALRDLSAAVGADCSSMKDSILSGVEKELRAKYNGTEHPVQVSKEQVRGDFTAALAKVIADKRAMNDSLAAAALNLPSSVVDYLRAALATKVDFNSVEMKALAENHDAAVPLLKLRSAWRVSEADYLGALANLKEKMGAGVGDDEHSAALCKMFLDVGKLASEAGGGKPRPVADSLKSAMAKHASQLAYVQQEIQQGGDYCCGPVALNHGIQADLMILRTFAQAFGLGPEISDAPPASGSGQKLSPHLEKMLANSGVSHARQPLADGKRFDVTLRSAFQETFLESCKGSVTLADDAGKYPDIPTAFKDTYLDYCRVSIGLTVGDTVIARVNDGVNGERRTVVEREMSAKLERFFGADEANGMRAARIISNLAQQGIAGNVSTSIGASGELMGGFPQVDAGHTMEFAVQRDADGSYGIHYKGTFLYENDPLSEDSTFDPGRSKVTYEIDLKLSFDAESGKPSLTFARPPTMSGRLTPSDLAPSDFSAIRSFEDPVSGKDFTDVAKWSGQFGDPTFKKFFFESTLTDAKGASAYEFLAARLPTHDDFRMLSVLGYNETFVNEMISGIGGDDKTPKLDKKLIGRLRNPATRNAAMQELTRIAAPIVRKGWVAGAPAVGPEMLNLITVAGLSTSSPGPKCDAERVAEFITQSQDPEVKKLPADLQSSDPSVVAAAKARLQRIVKDVRRAAGPSLLLDHIRGISDGDIGLLQRHVPATQYQHLLAHVINRDEHFDEALQNFRDLIAASKIIEQERLAALASSR